MEIYKVKVIDVINESTDVKTFIVELPDNVTYLEAAHMHVAIEGYRKDGIVNKDLVRHLTITSNPDEKVISFTTRFYNEISQFKKELLNIKVGDYVYLFKIENRIKLDRVNKDIVIISQGVGSVVAKPMIKSFIKNSENVKSITSLNINKTDEFTFKDELEKVKNDHINLIWVTNRADFYKELDEIMKNKYAVYYVIGSDDFLDKHCRYLLENGISKDLIRLDKKKEKIDELLNN